MHGIQKYYIFSRSKNLFQERPKSQWVYFFSIGSFLRVVFYSDGYLNLKFSGICVSKFFCGLGSTFQLADRSGMKVQFYFFLSFIYSVKVIRFLNV